MKKLILYLLFLLLGFGWTSAQNLTPNYSFDTISSCPGDVGQIYMALPWFQPNVYAGNTTNSSSSDLFDTCVSFSSAGVPINMFGNQSAITGIGYAGICIYYDTMNYREYLEVPLVTTLIANRRYCVEFYVSLAEASYNAISNMGAYFSPDSLLISSIYNHAIDTVTPQVENDTANMLSSKTTWMLVSGNFIANGGEKFMTIGNFHKPVNTHVQPVTGTSPYVGMAYYYIEDVSVVDCNPDGINDISSEFNNISVYPNPASTNITVSLKNNKGKLTLFNVLGKEMLTTQCTSPTINIDISSYPNGVYFLEMQTEKGVMRKKFVKQ